MKKLVLLPIIASLLLSCEPDYSIEQDWYSDSYMTWVWHNRKIVKSFIIERDSVTKDRIKIDSIKAVNFIDCVKNGKNCVQYKKEKPSYRIEQGFMSGYFNTWIWKDDSLVMSYSFEESKASVQTITIDSIKAVKWIKKVKNLTKN